MTTPLRTALAVLAAVALAALPACGGDPDSTGPDSGAAPACDPETDEALGAWEAAGFSGTVAIATGGGFECQAGYGYADEAAGTPNSAGTVFAIGSITKSFTAAAILRLAEDGALSLDDPAGELLPELTGPVAEATVRDLLLHTSGLTGSFGADDQPMTAAEALAAIDALEVSFPPGTEFLYSNAGYTLLALIVERVSGSTYREYLASTILPLPDGRVAGGFWNGEPAAPGGRAVGYLDDGATGGSGDFPGPHWGLDGNGGLAMSTVELASWTRALFTGGIVGPDSVEILTTPEFEIEEGTAETPGWAYYDESHFGEPVYGSSGGGGGVGHEAVAVWLPESDRVLAVASNRPEIEAGDLVNAVLPAMLAGEPLPTPEVPATPDDPAAIVGTYQLDTGGAYEVTSGDGRLTATATGADAVAALFPPGDGVTADDVREHEALVLALLAGETAEGRGERAALAESFGPVGEVTLAGSLVRDGELRTYVTLVTGGGPQTGWYAVNRAGGIEGAEVPTAAPATVLVPAGGARYRPEDPTGTGPDVIVEFTDGRMRITGPDGTTVAAAAG